MTTEQRTETDVPVAELAVGDSFIWCDHAAYVKRIELAPYKPRTGAHAGRTGRGGRWLHVTIPERREDLRLHYYDDEWVTAT